VHLYKTPSSDVIASLGVGFPRFALGVGWSLRRAKVTLAPPAPLFFVGEKLNIYKN
jgi:hypothetical protein